MKRIFALVLSFVFLLSCLVLPAGAMFDPSPVYQVQAASAYIVNTDTNIIVYDKDSTKQVSAGGLTKYMTLAVLLTNYADQLDNTFQMPFAISDYVYNTNNADMRSNETFTYREAMYAMLTRNANEAAMGVAYTLAGGDLDGWVAQMNTLSQRIGTTASNWTDACGIDSGNTTCAVDMYLILRYLMSFDAFVEVSGAPSFTMPAKEKHRSSSVLVSQNAALSKASGGSYYRSAMQGGMCNVTAFKNDTGTQSYVSWGNKDGATYIFCVMDSPDSCDTFGYANRRPALFETVKLMDWVFDSFSIQAALDTDLTIAEIPVKYSSDTDTLQLYPNANILVARRTDFEKANRKRFCAKIATGNYDIIVIGHSQFERIPLSQERQVEYLQSQIHDVISQVAQLKEERAENFTVKQMERMRKQLEKKLDKLNDQSRKDDVVTFEQLGVDSLMVDEAHAFKNLAVLSKMRNVAGISQTESQRASDLYMKCRYLDEITGSRGVVFATGTPISNSMAELFTMQRYLQRETLEQHGLSSFDAWASTFGETVTAVELAPEGTGYRTKTRFSKFYNLAGIDEYVQAGGGCADGGYAQPAGA